MVRNIDAFPKGPQGKLHRELDEALCRVGRDVRVAFELGSRDARDALAITRQYACRTYAFECNPASKPLIEWTLGNVTEEERARLIVVDLAVHHSTGVCEFRPVAGHLNIGASSLYRNVRLLGDQEYYPQGPPIEVSCTRLDDFCRTEGLTSVDVIWSDLQGADLMAVETLGDLLPTVAVVLMEVEYIRIYEHSVLFDEVVARMDQHGFVLHRNLPLVKDFGNALFIRRATHEDEGTPPC